MIKTRYMGRAIADGRLVTGFYFRHQDSDIDSHFIITPKGFDIEVDESSVVSYSSETTPEEFVQMAANTLRIPVTLALIPESMTWTLFPVKGRYVLWKLDTIAGDGSWNTIGVPHVYLDVKLQYNDKPINSKCYAEPKQVVNEKPDDSKV